MKIPSGKNTIFNYYLILLIVLFFVGFYFMIFIFKITSSSLTLEFLFHSLYYCLPFFFAIYILKSINEKGLDQIGTLDSSHDYMSKKSLLYAFITGYLISITYLNVVLEKELLYIVLLEILYLIIFFQIILTQTNSIVIIAELVLTFVNSVFSVSLQDIYYYIFPDFFVHIDWATITFSTGKIIPPEISNYSYYPIISILIAVWSNLFNLSIMRSYLIISGIVFSLSILIIYCLFKFFNREKIALLACLFYSTTGIIISQGLVMIGYILAFFFFILLFFLIYKINFQHSNKLIYYGLLIPVIVALVYSHHASMFFILGLFLIFYISYVLLQFFSEDKEKFNPYPFILFLCAFLIHWVYVAIESSKILGRIANDYFSDNLITEIRIPDVPTLIFQQTKIYQEIKTFITYMPSIILVFFIVVGIGFVIKQKFQKLLWIYAIIASISLLIWFPMGYYSLLFSSVFAIDRLLLFSSPFVMVIFALGFYYTLNYHFNFPHKYILILLTLLFIVYSFTSLISIPSYDYKFLSREGEKTNYFNKEDITSINFFDAHTYNGVIIRSDLYMYGYYSQKVYSETIKKIEWKYYHPQILKSTGSNSDEGGYIFYRKGEFKKTQILYTQPVINYNEHEFFERSFINFNKIFNTGNNEIFFT